MRINRLSISYTKEGVRSHPRFNAMKLLNQISQSPQQISGTFIFVNVGQIDLNAFTRLLKKKNKLLRSLFHLFS